MSTCPAAGCSLEIPFTMLMCRRHWALVPKPIQTEVYRAYTEHRRRHTYSAAIAHADICRHAVFAVAKIEGKVIPADNFWVQRYEELQNAQTKAKASYEASKDPAR